MHAIAVAGHGGAEQLSWTEMADPVPGQGEVLIDVAAAAVNRADIMQREGHYAPPPGASPVLGLECSGTVEAVGPGVDGWAVGDRVCALLAGGGYAEKVVAPSSAVLPVPDGVSLTAAAALPEVTCTVWSNVFMVSHLRAGEMLLVHGGSGGIGTMAIQIATAMGARVATTAGSKSKLQFCAELGADVLINYHEQDFVAEIAHATDGKGADVILDNMGASYLERNIDTLATNGRLAIIGMQGGATGELPILKLLGKEGTITATSLRARTLSEKAAVVAGVREHVWPLIAAGKVRPIIDREFPMADAADAQRLMEGSSHIGKILLTTP